MLERCSILDRVVDSSYDPVDKIVLEKNHVIKGNPVNVEKALPKEQTNRARMAQTNYGGPSGGGMRGPPPRMNTGGGGNGGGSGGWGNIGGESSYGGGSSGNGGGGYRPSSGGYGSPGDYGSRPAPPYTGGYSSDMTSGGGMMGYGSSAGGSGPMSRGGYGMGNSGPGGYDDGKCAFQDAVDDGSCIALGFGAFGQPSSYSFGQNYGSSGGGGPMRRGGPGMGRGGGGSAPYARGGGNLGRGGYRARN